MQHSNSTATPLESRNSIPDTTFPPLDTIYRPHTIGNLQNGNYQYHKHCSSPQSTSWRTLQRRIPLGSLRLGQSTIYEAYSRFICAFTGREEAAFRAKAIDSSRYVTLCAQVLLGDARSSLEKSVTWNLVDEAFSSDASIDFALNILGPNADIKLNNSTSHDFVSL